MMSNGSTGQTNVVSLEQELQVQSKERLIGIIRDMYDRMGSFETFVKRRFDEISMEINATSQQVDMAESDIRKQFAEMLEVVHAISYSGDGLTPANTGVELEAVIQVTEKAANRILDAADKITDKVALAMDEEDANSRDTLLMAVQAQVQEILMACEFQDLAGQRIRKTLENLNLIEERINSTLEQFGIEVTPPPVESNAVMKEAQISTGATQADIDALFA